MASPSFEVGRPSPECTEVTRTLERCLKESRAVDTESLCIIAGEKVRKRERNLKPNCRLSLSLSFPPFLSPTPVQVWSIRVDLHVLDHCGNITDCAAIAAVTALKHFRCAVQGGLDYIAEHTCNSVMSLPVHGQSIYSTHR